MMTLFLVVFVVGLVLSLMTLFSGVGHVHVGHFHVGHVHVGHHAVGGHGGAASPSGARLPRLNGFSLAAFLCWFGGVGYLLERFSVLGTVLVLLASAAAGVIAAALITVLIFRVLLPRERVLTREDTQMEGTLARVSDAVRAVDGVGEILFSQNGALRSAAARSDDGSAIARGTEVVVLGYQRGIATVRPIEELSREATNLTR